MPETPLLAGLPPVLDQRTRILVLGSFPGAASLAASQYYAHPRNQFWPMMSALLEDDLAAMPYEKRVKRLQGHGVGLWDVIVACERKGSLDSAIRRAQNADFGFLAQACPRLQTIGFNGKAAGRAEPRFADAGYRTLVLPSTSPAYVQLSFQQKLAQWRALLG